MKKSKIEEKAQKSVEIPFDLTKHYLTTEAKINKLKTKLISDLNHNGVFPNRVSHKTCNYGEIILLAEFDVKGSEVNEDK